MCLDVTCCAAPNIVGCWCCSGLISLFHVNCSIHSVWFAFSIDYALVQLDRCGVFKVITGRVDLCELAISLSYRGDEWLFPLREVHILPPIIYLTMRIYASDSSDVFSILYDEVNIRLCWDISISVLPLLTSWRSLVTVISSIQSLNLRRLNKC